MLSSMLLRSRFAWKMISNKKLFDGRFPFNSSWANQHPKESMVASIAGYSTNHQTQIHQNSQFMSSAPLFNESYSDDAIHMAPNCIRRMKELQASEGGEKTLRLSVKGGGCNGLSYVFNMEEKEDQNERVFESDGVKLVVDNVSYDFVKGAIIDYSEELIRSGFKVIYNPRAIGKCGCDFSFTVNL